MGYTPPARRNPKKHIFMAAQSIRVHFCWRHTRLKMIGVIGRCTFVGLVDVALFIPLSML